MIDIFKIGRNTMLLYKSLEYYKYNDKLKKYIRYYSVNNYEHYNKVLQAKKERGLMNG